jgi:hypothetical protein
MTYKNPRQSTGTFSPPHMKHPKSLKVVFAALAVSMVPLFGSCDSDELAFPELTDISGVNSWTFTLPEEFTHDFGQLNLGWYTFADDPNFVGELLKKDWWLVSQARAGQDVRLTLIEIESEGGSYVVIWQGLQSLGLRESVTDTIRNPLFGGELDPKLATTFSWPESEPLQLMNDSQKNVAAEAPTPTRVANAELDGAPSECLCIFQTNHPEVERTFLSLQVSFTGVDVQHHRPR